MSAGRQKTPGAARGDDWIDATAGEIAELPEGAHVRLEAPEGVEAWLQDNLRVLSKIASLPDASFGETEGTPDGVPERIGPYHIVDTIAEGGMGRVFLARQEEPVRRLVALKVIRPDRSTRTLQSRLESERQALALLGHPNIARLLEAGTTGDGLPWFAMEFVPGLPLVEWCDEHRASLETRLELMATVCDAVQHAHYRGILHRDLKPSNVLVEKLDGKAHPRVIDFGIARITTDLGAERETILTEAGQLLGTPEYMSPEQALGDPQKIDVRTDVYALGTLLYELLTGELPFDPDRLREGGLASLARILSTEEPPAPSARLRASQRSDAEAAQTSAAARGRTVPSLHDSLRGDLDWVVLRALEKDPEHRYGSAADLAADLRRVLRREPVSVGPRSLRYRAGRFVRQHRTAVAATAGAVVLLIAGAAATSWQAIRAREAEQEARRAETQAREQAQVTAAVNRILTGMLAQANPEVNPWSGSREPTLAQLLEGAYVQLDLESTSPAVEAEVLGTLANTWSVLGQLENADSSFARALAIEPAAIGADRRYELLHAAGLHALRRRDHERAGELARAARELAETEFGPGSARAAQATLQLAKVAARLGEHDRADSLFRVVSTTWPGSPASGNARAATGRDRVAHEGGDAGFASAGRDPHQWAGALNDYANLQTELGHFEPAEAALRRSLEILAATTGTQTPHYGSALTNLGRLLDRAGRYAAADSILGEAIEVLETTAGGGHHLASPMVNRASVLIQLDRPEDALALLDRAEPMVRETYGDTHASVGRLLGHRGTALQAMGDPAGAAAAYREALAIAEERDDPQEIFLAVNNLASTLRASGDHTAAEPLFRESLLLTRELYGDEHFRVAVVANNLARTLTDLAHYDEADSVYREALRVAEATFPEGHANVEIMRGNHAYCLLAMGRAAEAREMLEQVHAAMSEKLGPEHRRTRQVQEWLEEASYGSAARDP